MKFMNIKPKLIIISLYIIVLILFRILDLPCLWQHFLGIPCPGCGMTRAMFAVLRLDLLSAFRYHPMFWSVPIVFIYLFKNGGFFKNKTADKVILVMIGLGFAVNWVLQLL